MLRRPYRPIPTSNHSTMDVTCGFQPIVGLTGQFSLRCKSRIMHHVVSLRKCQKIMHWLSLQTQTFFACWLCQSHTFDDHPTDAPPANTESDLCWRQWRYKPTIPLEPEIPSAVSCCCQCAPCASQLHSPPQPQLLISAFHLSSIIQIDVSSRDRCVEASVSLQFMKIEMP